MLYEKAVRIPSVLGMHVDVSGVAGWRDITQPGTGISGWTEVFLLSHSFSPLNLGGKGTRGRGYRGT